MVVMFDQTKEYQIMPKEELTSELWVEKPCMTYESWKCGEDGEDGSKKAIS